MVVGGLSAPLPSTIATYKVTSPVPAGGAVQVKFHETVPGVFPDDAIVALGP